MTSLVAFGLDQIQRGTWWNEPTEPWRSNIAARQRSEEHRQCLLRLLRIAGEPVAIKDLADRAGMTIHSVRNLLKPALEAGSAQRRVINGTICYEAAACS